MKDLKCLGWTLYFKQQKWMRQVRDFLAEGEAGFGTVELVLILLVLVGLVLIFKEQVTDLVESIFSKITSKAGKI